MTTRTADLGGFLRSNRSRIIDRWSEAVRDLPKARALPHPALVDHLPQILDDLATIASTIAAGGPVEVPEHDAAAHAVQRLDVGFDLEEVADEYRILRRTILELVAAEEIALAPRELQFLNESIDLAMGRAISGYAAAQQRILRAIDRVSEAALASPDIEQMLTRLLQVFVQTTAPVDMIALLLRDGDRLRVRAATGFDRDVHDASVRIGEGFAGTVAQQQRPLTIRDASSDPLIPAQYRGFGIKGLYGVPLVDGDSVIGVAVMGSRSAPEFSREQQVLFRALANRATVMISDALTISNERTAGITARALAASETLDEAATRVLAGIGEAFAWDTGVYWRRDSDRLRHGGEWLAPGVESGPFHEASRHASFAEGEGLPGRAWRSGAVEWVANVAADAGLPRKVAARHSGLQSAIAFPLSTGDEILGVLEFFSRQERSAAEEAIEMMRAIAQQLPEFVRRVRTQELLRQSDAHKSAMLEVALDSIISMNGDGRVTAWNPAAERMFGYSEDEALGRELANLIIPPELRPAHRAGIDRYLATGESRYLNRRIDVPAMRRTGERIIVELAITRVPVEGPPMFTGQLRDVTGRREAEEEQLRLFREAEEASRMRERLLAIVAHDLRNPVAVVMGNARLLHKAPDDGEDGIRRRADAILRAASQMDRLIGDLLDTANIHRGGLSIDRKAFRLGEIVDYAAEAIQPAAAEKGVALTVDNALGDLECLCDRDRLLQALSNLLGNALKFSAAGSVIRVRAAADGGDATIEVADTGSGIPASDLPHIFDPYWSGRRGPHHEGAPQSTGLGLFISRGVVEAHGGRLWAESEPGRGSTFRFTLPLLA